jgi:hypothetical protein
MCGAFGGAGIVCAWYFDNVNIDIFDFEYFNSKVIPTAGAGVDYVVDAEW